MWDRNKKIDSINFDKIDIPDFSADDAPIKKMGIGKKRFLNFRSKVMDYIKTDCNINENIINSSNIKLLVDDNTRDIFIKASGNGKLCLNAISKGVIEQIANEHGYEQYDVKLDSN